MVTKFVLFEIFSPIFYVKISGNIPVFYYTIIYRVFLYKNSKKMTEKSSPSNVICKYYINMRLIKLPKQKLFAPIPYII